MVSPPIGIPIAPRAEFLAEAGVFGATALGLPVARLVGTARVIPFMPGIADIARRAESDRAAESRCCLVTRLTGCCPLVVRAMVITENSPTATRVIALADRAIVVMCISHLN